MNVDFLESEVAGAWASFSASNILMRYPAEHVFSTEVLFGGLHPNITHVEIQL